MRGLAFSPWRSFSPFRSMRLRRELAMHSLAGWFARAPIGFLIPRWAPARFLEAFSAGTGRLAFDGGPRESTGSRLILTGFEILPETLIAQQAPVPIVL